MSPHIFQNAEFFVLLVPAIIALLLAKRIGPVVFRLAIIAVSVFFIAVLPMVKPAYLLLVAALLAVSYLVGISLVVVRQRKHRVRLIYVILGCLLVFSAVKFESVSAVVSSALGLGRDYRVSLLPIFGFAFLLVKIYSLLADICSDKIKELRLLDFLSYLLFFPSYLAGPIERFVPFSKTLHEAAASRDELSVMATQIPRFVIGAFKVFVVAGFLQRFALPFLKENDFANGYSLYIGIVCYYAFEYMNFSGYSDMAIGTARMLGIRLPENFSFPFMAKSLTEMWRRWHISFANWLRDYIYYPVLFMLMQKVRPGTSAGQAWLSAAAIFITFVMCGLWHGDQLGMILFGALSGLVLGAEAILTHRYYARLSQLSKSRPGFEYLYNFGARVVTFHIACLTFAPVLLNKAQMRYILRYFFG